MVKRFSILTIFCLVAIFGHSQNKEVWQTLSMVTFETNYDPATMMEVKKPKVSKAVTKIDGTQISIEGYIIPLTGQVTQSHFMLSKFPQST